MQRIFSLYVLVVSILVLQGCAGPVAQLPDISAVEIAAERQRQTAFDFDRYMHDLDRVKSVGHRVLSANSGACGQSVRPFYGFEAATLEDLKKIWQRRAAEKLGVSSPVTIIQIVKTGPAYRAGLRRGDHIVRLSNAPVAIGRGATEKFNRQMRNMSATASISFDIRRGELRKTIAVAPVRACAYPVLITTAKSSGAYTDGSNIVVHQGLLKVASTDAELALVIGHELAHITSGHLSSKKQNQIAGLAGGLAVDALFAVAGLNTGGTFAKAGGKAGAAKYSQEFEKESDYIGMYYLARAGYPTLGVETFWRKMAGENPRSITMARSHPTSPERFLLIRRTHEEISAKRRNRQKLEPNKSAG